MRSPSPKKKPAPDSDPDSDSDPQVTKLVDFLRKFYSDDLRRILDAEDSHLNFSLVIEFAELMDFDPKYANELYANPRESLIFLDKAAKQAQRKISNDSKNLKPRKVHVRIDVSGSPLEFPEASPSIGKVRVKHMGTLVALKGTVIRSGGVKMIEYERKYMCKKCRKRLCDACYRNVVACMLL